MRNISRRAALVLAAMALLGVPAVRAQQSPEAAKAQAELTEIIKDFVASYGNNNVDKYFSYYADDLTWWGPNGRNTKAQYYKSWSEGVKTTGGLASSEYSDLRIQLSPSNDLAIASYLLKVRRNNPNPPTRTEFATYEMSPTLIKRNGVWKIVHLHFQTVPEPAPGR